MNALYWTIRNFLEAPREEGQTMTEYALILFFIAVAVIAVLVILGPQIAAVYTAISAAL